MENNLDKIHHSALKFLLPLTIEETYKLIVEEAMKLTKADHGSILLNKKRLTRVYASNPALFQVKPRKKGYMNLAFKTQKTIIVTPEKVSIINPSINKADAKSILIIPLSYLNKCIGIITLLSPNKNQFSQKEVEIMELFSPLASLAIEKTQLQEQTQRALEVRDLFISMASHELRTPLTTINGYVQLLNDKYASQNNTEAKWVKELSWEISRLTGLIKDLLDINKVKTGKLQYNWNECSLKEIINEAIKDFQLIHPQYKVTFKNELNDGMDITVGDSDKLLQVVTNLLNNAAKSSFPGAEVSISLNYKRSHLVFSIQNQSQRAFGKIDLSHIFEDVYGEDMELGLFLAKDIIQHHKGSIKIYSKANKRTKVEIKLPRINYFFTP